MKKPADAARAPGGVTKTTTGTGEVAMAVVMSRVVCRVHQPAGSVELHHHQRGPPIGGITEGPLDELLRCRLDRVLDPQANLKMIGPSEVRHKGQSRSSNEKPEMTSPPTTSQTRRHEDQEPLEQPRRHRERTEPPIHRNLPTDHADRHRWSRGRLEHVARFRPSNDGRGPLGRTIASDASVRRDVATQRPALSKSAGLATPQPLLADGRRRPSNKRRGARRNRRAPGALAGGKLGCDERSRSEQTSFPPVGGDRRIADCSAANPRYDFSVSARFSLRICVICVICGQIAMGGRPLCLRVFVFAMSLCFSPCLCASVPLWFNR